VPYRRKSRYSPNCSTVSRRTIKNGLRSINDRCASLEKPSNEILRTIDDIFFWSSYALKRRGRRARVAYEITGIMDLVCWRYYRQRQQKSPEQQQLSEVASILLIIGNSVRYITFWLCDARRITRLLPFLSTSGGATGNM
jgi:hypothetical protein